LPYLVLYFEIFIYSYCSNKYFLWGSSKRDCTDSDTCEVVYSNICGIFEASQASKFIPIHSNLSPRINLALTVGGDAVVCPTVSWV